MPHSKFYPTKDLHRNRGPGGLSRDFAYNLSVIYELPAGPGKGRFESGPASKRNKWDGSDFSTGWRLMAGW